MVDFFPVAPKPRRVEKGGIKNAPEDQNKSADDDYWSKDDENECVIRIHRTPRKKLFDPRGSNCPIDIEFLADETLTIIKYLNGENDSIQSTTWRNLSDPKDDQSQEWIGETYFQVDVHALEKWGDTSRGDAPPSDDDYEPMSEDEIEEALRGRDYDPLADFAEEESSIAPAVPGEEHDHYKAPKFAPVAKPGVFLGYRFEPGGKWKGDYYVADLEHFQAGVVRPSIHQVKQIYHNAEEPFVFPLLKAYEARTREIASYKHDRLSDPDHPSGKILPREDESFSFDEGRFDHGDDEGDRQDRLNLTIFLRLTSLIITSPMNLPLTKGMTTGCALKKKGPGIDTTSRRERTSLETTPVLYLQGGRSKLISTMSESLIATSSTPETRSIATPVMCMPAAIGLEHTNSGPGLPSFSTRAARPKGGVPLPRSRSAKT